MHEEFEAALDDFLDEVRNIGVSKEELLENLILIQDAIEEEVSNVREDIENGDDEEEDEEE